MVVEAVADSIPDLHGEPAEVALLDRRGVIVAVNDAWRDFAERNGGDPSRTGVGVSYLDACSGSDDVTTEHVASAIRGAVVGNLTAPVMITIRCDAPDLPRSFDVFVSSRLNDDGSCLGATVTLAQRPTDELDSSGSDWVATEERLLGADHRTADVLRRCASIITDLSVPGVLRGTVEVACDLTQARYAALGIADETGRVIEFAHVDPQGLVPDECAGLSHAQVMLAMVSDSPRPVRLRHLAEHPSAEPGGTDPAPLDSLLAVPVPRTGRPLGVLYLANSRWGGFDDEDEQATCALAEFAGVAIEQAARSRDQQYGPQADPAPSVPGETLQQRAVEIFDEVRTTSGLDGQVYFAGLADRTVSAELAEDVESVIRAGLAILTEHADAGMIAVGLSLTGTSLTIDLIDDGHGALEADAARLAPLRERARDYGGSLELSPGSSRGTFLRWSARLPDAP